jgi:hypothetical protein
MNGLNGYTGEGAVRAEQYQQYRETPVAAENNGASVQLSHGHISLLEPRNRTTAAYYIIQPYDVEIIPMRLSNSINPLLSLILLHICNFYLLLNGHRPLLFI